MVEHMRKPGAHWEPNQKFIGKEIAVWLSRLNLLSTVPPCHLLERDQTKIRSLHLCQDATGQFSESVEEHPFPHNHPKHAESSGPYMGVKFVSLMFVGELQPMAC